MAEYHVRETGTLGGDGSAENPWLYLDQVPVAGSIPANSTLYLDGVIRLRFSGAAVADFSRDGLTGFTVRSLDPLSPAIVKGSTLESSGWTNTAGNVWTKNIGTGKTAAIFGVAVNYDTSIRSTGEHYGFLVPGSGLNTWSYDNATGVMTIELDGGEDPNTNTVVEICLGNYNAAIVLTSATDSVIQDVWGKQHIDGTANHGYAFWVSGTRSGIVRCKGWDCGYHFAGVVANGSQVNVDCYIRDCYGYSLSASSGTMFVAYSSGSDVVNFYGSYNGALLSGIRTRTQARLNPTYRVDGFYNHTGGGAGIEHTNTEWAYCWTDAVTDAWGFAADGVNASTPSSPTDPRTYGIRFYKCYFACPATGKQGSNTGSHVSYERCIFDHTLWPQMASAASPPTGGIFNAAVNPSGVGYILFSSCFFKTYLKNSNASTVGRYLCTNGFSTNYWHAIGRNCTFWDNTNGVGAATIKAFFNTSNGSAAVLDFQKNLFVYEVANTANRLFHNDTSTPSGNLTFTDNIYVGIGATAWSSAATRDTPAEWLSVVEPTATQLAVAANYTINVLTGRPSSGLFLRKKTTAIAPRSLNQRRNGNLRGAWQDGGQSRLVPGATGCLSIYPT